MKNKTLILFRQFKAFWKSRKIFKKLEFLLIKFLFHKKTTFEETSIRTSIGWELTKISIAPIASAFLCSLLLYYLDRACKPLFLATYSSEALLDSYTSLLGTIAGVGGVFIGLYYAGLTATGTAIYSEVPNNIRNLLARERRGGIYMSFLSFVTFLSLSLIILNLLGFGPCKVGLIVIVFLAGIGIFVFVHLGKLAFNYFDPTVLAEPFIYELQTSIKEISNKGLFYRNESVHNHFHKLATTAIETLETLSSIIEKAKHLNGSSYLDYSKNIFRLLIFYQNQKPRIPTKSYWYRIKYQHQDWYKSDSSSVEMAQRTGTVIAPKNTQELNWFEADLISIPIACFKVNLAEKRHEVVLSMIGWFKAYLLSLANSGEVKQAFEIQKNLVQVFFETTREKDSKKYPDSLESIAAFEILTSIQIELLIKYGQSFSKMNREFFFQQLKATDWNDSSSIYNSGFPFYVLADIEWLQKTLSFEKETEGKILSPIWYMKELLTLWNSKRILENIKVFIYSSNTLRDWILKTIPLAENPWLASCFLSRQFEYLNKLESRMQALELLWTALMKDRRIKELTWPEVDFTKLNESIENQKTALLKLLPTTNDSLEKQRRTDEFPDYFGQFLYTMGEASFSSALHDRIEPAKELYPSFLKGSLSKFSQIFPDGSIPRWQFDSAFLIACGPVLDLIELSGFIKLFSEYYKNDQLWNEVVKTWDLYLSEHTERRLELMATLINFEESRPSISASSLHRTTWSQQALRFLFENVQRVADERDRGHGIFSTIGYEELALHESALVRIFSTDKLLNFYDGTDIFIDSYFSKRAEAQRIKFNRKSDRLKDSLDREEKNSSYVMQLMNPKREK